MKSRTKSSTLEISTAADAEDSKPSRDGLATDNVLAGALLEFSMVSVVLRVTVMVKRRRQLFLFGYRVGTCFGHGVLLGIVGPREYDENLSETFISY